MDEPNSETDASPVEKKKGKGALIGLVVAAVLVVSAGAAGAVMGPKFFAKPAPTAQPEDDSADGDEPKADSEGSSEGASEDKPKLKEFKGEVHEVTNLQPIVVDTVAADGQVRHLRISLSIEHPEGINEAAFKSYVPRAREAAIRYLRTHDYEQLSAPKNFEQLRKELNDEIIAAVGKKRAHRVLITDFVAQ